MATLPQFSDAELLSQLTPAVVERLDDETVTRLAGYLRMKRQDEIDARCAQEVASFSGGVLYWLTQLTKTENPQYESQGLPFLAPFPQKSYFVPLLAEFLKKHRELFVPKSRTMMTSWAAMGFATHRAQYFREETIVQTANEDKCAHLIDYVRQLWDNQEDWLKRRHPLIRRSAYALAWAGGGEVASIPSGPDKIRAFHPTWYVQDESAFLPEGEACLSAVKPAGAHVICISSAASGWFGDQCQR
jgi:hypothetical protein